MIDALPSPAAAPTALPPSAALERDLLRLRQGSHYLKMALDQVSEGVMILMPGQDERDAYVMHANAQAHILLGGDPTTGLRERTLAQLTANRDEEISIKAALQRALKSGGSTVCDCELRCAVGPRVRQFRCVVRAVSNEHGVLMNYTVAFRPLEEVVEERVGGRVAAEEDGEALVARLRTENLAALAQGIAHDVNNLLGPMMTQLSMTMQQTELQPTLKADLELMFASLKRARQFTQQVVKVAKSGHEERRPTDMVKLAKETVSLCAAGSNVEVIVTAEKNMQWALADGVRMSQVLQNLVMNGVQAMPQGGRMFVELTNCLIEEADEVEGLCPGRYVDIRVRDRGVGMSEETLGRLFKESFTTKEDGNGIGLTAVNRFVREQGGRILVTSMVNVGTEFRVLLPAVSPELENGNAVPTAPIPLQRGEGRVLLVDDEAPLRHVARCILTQCGYEVMEVDNGEDAITMYRQALREGAAPDVVLMDLTLRGGLSGTETARELLVLDPAAKLVVTSGSVTEDIQKVFLDEGFVGILPKPYEAGALTETVRAVIDMKARA
jgi:signal transduction histidine kinase/ActR/RegA family two-component response regulator